MNLRSLPPLDRLDRYDVTDWLTGRGIIYGLSLVLVVLLSVYAYLEHRQTSRQWQRAERFAQFLADYRYLRRNKSGEEGSNKKTLENPLSYLENQVSQKNLAGLTPVGSKDGRNRYRLSLDGVSAQVVFSLIRTFDRQPGLAIDTVTFERISLDSESFDANLELSVSTR